MKVCKYKFILQNPRVKPRCAVDGKECEGEKICKKVDKKIIEKG